METGILSPGGGKWRYSETRYSAIRLVNTIEYDVKLHQVNMDIVNCTDVYTDKVIENNRSCRRRWYIRHECDADILFYIIQTH